MSEGELGGSRAELDHVALEDHALNDGAFLVVAETVPFGLILGAEVLTQRAQTVLRRSYRASAFFVCRGGRCLEIRLSLAGGVFLVLDSFVVIFLFLLKKGFWGSFTRS